MVGWETRGCKNSIMMKYKIWSKEDTEKFIKCFSQLGHIRCAEIFNTTIGRVKSKAYYHELKLSSIINRNGFIRFRDYIYAGIDFGLKRKKIKAMLIDDLMKRSPLLCYNKRTLNDNPIKTHLVFQDKNNKWYFRVHHDQKQYRESSFTSYDEAVDACFQKMSFLGIGEKRIHEFIRKHPNHHTASKPCIGQLEL